MHDPTPVYVRCAFQLDEGEIGRIQYLLHDEQRRAVEVAAQFGISVSHAYRIKNAVPGDLCHIDAAAQVRFRRKHGQRRAPRRRAQ